MTSPAGFQTSSGSPVGIGVSVGNGVLVCVGELVGVGVWVAGITITVLVEDRKGVAVFVESAGVDEIAIPVDGTFALAREEQPNSNKDSPNKHNTW